MWLRVSTAAVRCVAPCSTSPLSHSVLQELFSKDVIWLNRSHMSYSLLTSSGKAKKVLLCIFKISFN